MHPLRSSRRAATSRPTHHWLADRSWLNTRQERTMERNWRMVMMRAKCRAPYCWMV